MMFGVWDLYRYIGIWLLFLTAWEMLNLHKTIVSRARHSLLQGPCKCTVILHICDPPEKVDPCLGTRCS